MAGSIKIVVDKKATEDKVDEIIIDFVNGVIGFPTFSVRKEDREIFFTFLNKNDDGLIRFLWDTVLYFKNGAYPAVEKVTFVLGEKEIKLHPIDTAVS